MSEQDQSAPRRLCKNDGKPMSVPACARTSKLFCSNKCRAEWHARQRARALAALRQQEGQDAKAKETGEAG
jgi:hypothetical protein